MCDGASANLRKQVQMHFSCICMSMPKHCGTETCDLGLPCDDLPLKFIIVWAKIYKRRTWNVRWASDRDYLLQTFPEDYHGKLSTWFTMDRTRILLTWSKCDRHLLVGWGSIQRVKIGSGGLMLTKRERGRVRWVNIVFWDEPTYGLQFLQTLNAILIC